MKRKKWSNEDEMRTLYTNIEMGLHHKIWSFKTILKTINLIECVLRQN